MDGQVHQAANPETQNSAAAENPCAAWAHSNGIAAWERNDATRDRGGDGCFVEHREPCPRAYDGGGIKALKPKPIGGRKRETSETV